MQESASLCSLSHFLAASPPSSSFLSASSLSFSSSSSRELSWPPSAYIAPSLRSVFLAFYASPLASLEVASRRSSPHHRVKPASFGSPHTVRSRALFAHPLLGCHPLPQDAGDGDPEDEGEGAADSSQFLQSLRRAAMTMAVERDRQERQGERLIAAMTAHEREEQRERERRRQEQRRRMFAGDSPLTLEALRRDKELGYALDELVRRKRREKQKNKLLALPFKQRFPLRLLRVGSELYGRVKKILPFGCRLDVGCLDTAALLHVRDMADITEAKRAGERFAQAFSGEDDARADLPQARSASRGAKMSQAGFSQDDQVILAQHWIQNPGTILREGELVRVFVKHVDPVRNVLAVTTRPPSSPSASSLSAAAAASSPSSYRGDLTAEEIGEREAARPARRAGFGDFFVGQEVEGRVTRVTYMGIFVDINGEQDAFIHFYELHRRRMHRLSNADKQKLDAARRQYDPVALEVLRAAERVVTDEAAEAERRRERKREEEKYGCKVLGGYSRLAALREMFNEAKDPEDAGGGAEAEHRKQLRERSREREIRERKWLYDVGDWVTDLRVASVDASRKRIQLSRRPASELLTRWRAKLRDEQRGNMLTPQQREGLEKEEAEEENEAVKALRQQREEELALKVYRQYKKKMQALAREGAGESEPLQQHFGSSSGLKEEGERREEAGRPRTSGEAVGGGQEGNRAAREDEPLDPLAKKKADQMKRFRNFGIGVFEEKRDEQEVREALDYLQRWRAGYAHRRLQEEAYKEKRRLQRLQRKAPDEMSVHDAWRLAATIKEEVELKDLVADAKAHARMSGVSTLQIPDFSGRYPKVKEIEPEELEAFYPGVVSSEAESEASQGEPVGDAEAKQETEAKNDGGEGGGRDGAARPEGPEATEVESASCSGVEREGAQAAQEGEVWERLEEGTSNEKGRRRPPETGEAVEDSRRAAAREETPARTSVSEGSKWSAEEAAQEAERIRDVYEGDFFGRAFEKMKLRTERELQARATQPRVSPPAREGGEEEPDAHEEDTPAGIAPCTPTSLHDETASIRAEDEEGESARSLGPAAEEAETPERAAEGDKERDAQDKRSDAEARQKAEIQTKKDMRREETDLQGDKPLPVPPSPDEFVNVGKSSALRVLRDLALATSRSTGASSGSGEKKKRKKDVDFTEEERQSVLRDLRMHALEAVKQIQKKPEKKVKGGKNSRAKQEAWAAQAVLEAEEEAEEWREKVKAGYRDETDDAFDEVLSALGIEDLTQEVLEEARQRQILRKLQADRTDLAGDVKKILHALVSQKDREEVRAFEEAAGEVVTSEADWERKASAAQRLLFEGTEVSWKKEIEQEFGEPDVMDDADKKIQATLLQHAEQAERKSRKQERKAVRAARRAHERDAQAKALAAAAAEEGDAADGRAGAEADEAGDAGRGKRLEGDGQASEEDDEERMLLDLLTEADDEGFIGADEAEAAAYADRQRRAWWEHEEPVFEGVPTDERVTDASEHAGEKVPAAPSSLARQRQSGDDNEDDGEGDDEHGEGLGEEAGGRAASKRLAKRKRRKMAESDFDEDALLSEIQQDLRDLLAAEDGGEERERGGYQHADGEAGEDMGTARKTPLNGAPPALSLWDSLPSLPESSAAESSPLPPDVRAATARARHAAAALATQPSSSSSAFAPSPVSSPASAASACLRFSLLLAEKEAHGRAGAEELPAEEADERGASSDVSDAPHSASEREPPSLSSALESSCAASSPRAAPRAPDATESSHDAGRESAARSGGPPPACRGEVFKCDDEGRESGEKCASCEPPRPAEERAKCEGAEAHRETLPTKTWQRNLSARARLLLPSSSTDPSPSSSSSSSPSSSPSLSSRPPLQKATTPRPPSGSARLSSRPALVAVGPSSSASPLVSARSREDQLVRDAVLSLALRRREEKDKKHAERDAKSRNTQTAAEGGGGEDGGDKEEGPKGSRPLCELLEEERERKEREREQAEHQARQAAKREAAYGLRLPQRPVRTLEQLKSLQRKQQKEADDKEQQDRAREKKEALKEERRRQQKEKAARLKQKDDAHDADDTLYAEDTRRQSPHRIILEAARRSHEKGVFEHLLGTLHSDDAHAKNREKRVLQHAGELHDLGSENECKSRD
ncbi:S1 RNA binding domain-containing protein [Besnoitia besnoiti]|uniref:S1 RNA binding domain-containing protein n=1 Tax=Besnoitia besnoiti TaxID=94643 RepID=A0A2A9MPS3_BESBE|nr:S1 RNA binding domain-containing protein [Besnoitia besnoiti]PFH38376.1 S1 RNA binding domain-containing protein [Besnoitia besnoiti]